MTTSTHEPDHSDRGQPTEMSLVVTSVGPPMPLGLGSDDPDYNRFHRLVAQEHWVVEKIFGLDPQVWYIVAGTLQVKADRSADVEPSKRRHQVSAKLRRRSSPLLPRQEFIDLLKDRPARPTGVPRPGRIEATQVICVADLQTGKKESGGARGLRQRWNTAVRNLVEHFTRQEAVGRLPSSVLVVGLGDLIEQCVAEGQGLTNTPFACDLTTSEQMELALALLDDLIDLVVDLFDHVQVAAVPGNHGERRSGSGRTFTNTADNYDLDLFRRLRFAYDKHPKRYGHLQWTIADQLGVVVESSNTVIALAHGHQKIGRGSATASLDNKAVGYWERAAFARVFNKGFHEADVFVTGHYHHLRIADVGNGRVWLQAPALEGVEASSWVAERGVSAGSSQGILTFTTAEGRLWDISIATSGEEGSFG